MITGLSNQVVGLKEREAKGAIVAEEVKRLQGEISKLKNAIEALTATAMEKKEAASPPALPQKDTKNEELEAKVKALERKVKKLSKPKLEEPKASPVIEQKVAPAMPAPPPPIVTAMEVYSPPGYCNTTTHHQLVHRRSGIFGLGILGRRQ
jgi:outer membrane murein-binding lipoprotein Lpp